MSKCEYNNNFFLDRVDDFIGEFVDKTTADFFSFR